MARKLILTRDESADRVLEAIEATRENALTVVAPRGSALADREGLARIGEAAAERGVAVAIESVDEELLSLAHAAHLETVHPFFRADRRHLSLDGIVKSEEQSPRIPVRVEEATSRDRDEDQAETRVAQIPTIHHHPIPTPVSARPSAETERPRSAEAPREDKPRGRASKLRIAIAALVALAIIVGVGEAFFRGGSVTVAMAETPWEYQATVTAATSVTAPGGGGLSIPGQLFPESNRNIAQSFAATGDPDAASVPTSAKPRVTVYNEGLEAETFVVKTRFEGKSGIFRAATAVAIPAAKKSGDALVPGSATVEVTPESAAVLEGATDKERLTVPGLAGSAKASLFYGELLKPAAETSADTGSTVPPSERVVTAADEESAKSKISEVLAASHRVKVIAQAPGLNVIEGAVTVAPTQLTVNKEVDAQGNFNLVGQADVTAMAFREDDLKALLLQQAATQTGISYPLTFRSVEISYADVTPQFADGKLQFTVKAKGVLVGELTDEQVRKEAAGKSKGDVAAWLKGQPSVATAQVGASPFWRFSLPGREDQVKVEIQ